MNTRELTNAELGPRNGTPMTTELPVLDPVSHRYSLNGIAVPGVTEILAPLTRQLQRVDPGVLSAAAAFGTAVHKACELDDLGALDEDSLDPGLLPYLNAWRRFSRDHQVRWTLIEARVYNPQLGYAGTVDRYGSVKGEEAVVDLKSGASVYPSTGPQLAAYAKAIPAATPLTRRIAVLLKPSGDYQVKVFSSALDWAVFASLITLRSFCALNNITADLAGKESIR